MLFNQILKVFPLILLAAAGCNKNIIPGASSKISLPDQAGRVINSQNQFAFRLFKATLENDPGNSNKLVSPVSIYLDLSMVYNGAAGTTQTGMQQALQLHDVNTGLLNNTNQALIIGLPKADPHVTLGIANSIWYRNQGSQPLPAFLKTNSTYYKAQVTGADFSPATVKQINDWVAGQTHQKIKTIIQQIDPADVMYLINAVYFKGEWKNSFDPEKTHDMPFYTSDNRTIRVPFMMKDDRFNYMQNDSLQMIGLPYGNGDFNMYVMLPSGQAGLNGLLASLNEETLKQYVASMDSVKVKLSLPKWKYSYEIGNLKPELGSLGMSVAFTGQADFSGMYPAGAETHISKVVHKAYIEVNERGTEAAAATSIGITTTAVMINQPVMNANRPFLYLITGKNSGVILFIGVVENPAEGTM